MRRNNYTYDNNGNRTSSDQGNITYTSFNKARVINHYNSSLSFEYDSDLLRVKQVKKLSGSIQETKYYIGSNGKLIAFSKNNNFNKKLPFVFSKSNYKNFVNLKKIIDKSKFKLEDIESFYYFPSNRWDLKTKSGLLIKLPEKNILDSLQYAHLIKVNEQFKDNKIIDLRISNNIITSNE